MTSCLRQHLVNLLIRHWKSYLMLYAFLLYALCYILNHRSSIFDVWCLMFHTRCSTFSLCYIYLPRYLKEDKKKEMKSRNAEKKWKKRFRIKIEKKKKYKNERWNAENRKIEEEENCKGRKEKKKTFKIKVVIWHDNDISKRTLFISFRKSIHFLFRRPLNLNFSIFNRIFFYSLLEVT